MDRQQVKELLPIIQAFAEGKTIQGKCTNDTWIDINKEDFINLLKLMEYYDLRVKPEPKFRPFKDKEECWEEMQKHQPFGWVKDGPRKCNIICIREDGIIANTNVHTTWYNFEESSFNLKFADGTPFGIKE